MVRTITINNTTFIGLNELRLKLLKRNPEKNITYDEIILYLLEEQRKCIV